MKTETEIQTRINQLLVAAGVDGEFPVRVEKIVEYLGFKCQFFKPDQETNHIAGAVSHAKKKIYINQSDPPQRQLFTVAHEIGHILLHGDQTDYVDYRDSTNNPKETAANNFAANLLMPETIFRYQWKNFNGNIYAVAHFFGVSISAISIRATALGLDIS